MTYEYDLHESKEAGRAEAKREMVDAMLVNGKLSEKDIAAISGIPEEEIAQRKAALSK